jgi:hypothetical protein
MILVLVQGYYKLGSEQYVLLVCGHARRIARNSVLDTKKFCDKEHCASAQVYHAKSKQIREKR